MRFISVNTHVACFGKYSISYYTDTVQQRRVKNNTTLYMYISHICTKISVFLYYFSLSLHLNKHVLEHGSSDYTVKRDTITFTIIKHF